MTTSTLSAPRNSALGFQVRVKRVARLLTQRELAAMAGVAPEEVARLESGEAPSPDTAHRLLAQLGIAQS